jgi:hypothetical protein
MLAYFLSEDSDSERSASIARRIEEVVPGLVKIANIEDIGGGGIAAAMLRRQTFHLCWWSARRITRIISTV